MRPHHQAAAARGFTLIELLLTLAIILLLISMLLPALSRGPTKIKSLQCRSNLHQTGIAELYFANTHEDKFPMQVSTNNGGSLEFLTAGQAVQGDFYFSYRHFVPLAPELQSPKLLVCPADSRSPATNFNALRNTNLSYFAAANPVYMSSDSILSGDRNLTPVSNSTARLSVYRPLRWTSEMHRNRGNVLFADAHVEQLNDILSLSNSPGTPPITLVMPSTKIPAAALAPSPGSGVVQWGGGGGGGIPGGSLSVSASATNQFAFTNGVITNLIITSGPRHTPPWAYLKGGPGGGGSAPAVSLPDQASGPQAVSAPVGAPPSEIALAAEAASEPSEAPTPDSSPPASGQRMVERGLSVIGEIPWWLLAILAIIALWLLKRAREHRPAATRSKQPPWVVEGRN